jgi:SAM-dependent methyltransferase
MLEHTPDPKSVIEEISRVLKPGGIVLICVPFSTRIHADPYDYGRYTDYFWSETLTRYGFKIEVIEKQGLFWSVILDMVRDGLYAVTAKWKSSFVLNLVFTLFGYARLMAIRFDRKLSGSLQSSLAGYTTGFGIKAYKE